MMWRGGSEQPIGVLRDRWPRIKKFEVRVRVEDGRPEELGGPGVGVSEWKTIKIEKIHDRKSKAVCRSSRSLPLHI